MASNYTVGQINAYIKNMFKQDFVLNKISIKGEISNCKYHTSGHIYFTLKDETGTLSAVMFAGYARSLKMRLENGMQVIANGRIDVYERDGRYQLYVYSVENDGMGNLYRRFEQLKNELEEMGMFAAEYKKPIPRFCRTVGIVTASTGAAVQDIINIATRRNPYVQLILYPAIVQGELACNSIVRGIRTLDAMRPDVIIVGRGGGSIEDLWAFNEESVARAIFDADTPVISAVGHEVDFTIADFVADMRAPTPSAAAELAVADIGQLTVEINSRQNELIRAMQIIIERRRTLLTQKKLRLDILSPRSRLNDNRQLTIDYEEKLSLIMKQLITNHRHRLALYSERLDGLSPLRRLSSGYAYVQTQSGGPLKSIDDSEVGEFIRVNLTDGHINAKITNIERSSNGQSNDN